MSKLTHFSTKFTKSARYTRKVTKSGEKYVEIDMWKELTNLGENLTISSRKVSSL